jgi:hypothetical protein
LAVVFLFLLFFSVFKTAPGCMWWLMPVLPEIQEVEIRRIVI